MEHHDQGRRAWQWIGHIGVHAQAAGVGAKAQQPPVSGSAPERAEAGACHQHGPGSARVAARLLTYVLMLPMGHSLAFGTVLAHVFDAPDQQSAELVDGEFRGHVTENDVCINLFFTFAAGTIADAHLAG